MFRKMTIALALVLGVAAVLITACTYVGPEGQQHTLTPFRKDPPPKRTLISCVHIDGAWYCLYDSNGDGKVDLVRRMSDRRLYEVVDPFNVPPEWLEHENRVDMNDEDEEAGGGGAGTDGGLTWPAFLARLEEIIGEDSDGPDNSGATHNPFGDRSAAEWIEFYGLNVESGQRVELNNLHLDLFDTTSWHTKVTLYWRSDFHLARMADHDLDYVWYALEGETDEDPWFLAMTFEGDAVDVISALVEMGSEALAFTGEDGEQWSVVTDGVAATLSLDGVALITLPLE